MLMFGILKLMYITCTDSILKLSYVGNRCALSMFLSDILLCILYLELSHYGQILNESMPVVIVYC